MEKNGKIRKIGKKGKRKVQLEKGKNVQIHKRNTNTNIIWKIKKQFL